MKTRRVFTYTLSNVDWNLWRAAGSGYSPLHKKIERVVAKRAKTSNRNFAIIFSPEGQILSELYV